MFIRLPVREGQTKSQDGISKLERGRIQKYKIRMERKKAWQ